MTTPPVAPAMDASVAQDKRAQAETLLTDILRLMDYPAKLDFKDMADGGIGVAVHFEGEYPGVTPGKKSFLMESLQFLVNKVVNRPQTEKRWVTLGLGAFPEPRSPGTPRAMTAAAVPAAPAATGANAPAPAPAPAAVNGAAVVAAAPAHGRERGPKRGRDGTPPVPRPSAERRGKDAHRRHEPEEASLDVAEDPAVTKLAKLLAEKSAAKGRVYAVARLSVEDRARFLKAAKGLPGVSVKVEGDGHFRRVVFTPDKPAPILKRSVMPDFDEDDDG